MDLTSAASANNRFHSGHVSRFLTVADTCSRGTPTFTHREFMTVPGSREDMANMTRKSPSSTKNMDLTFLIGLYLFPTEDADGHSVNADTPEHEISDLRAAVGDMRSFEGHIPHGLIEMRQG